MKNQFLLLVALFICTTTFAQKDELKAAEKAVKKNDYAKRCQHLIKMAAFIQMPKD